MAIALTLSVPGDSSELGTDGYADSKGVKIHYVTTGKGPFSSSSMAFPIRMMSGATRFLRS